MTDMSQNFDGDKNDRPEFLGVLTDRFSHSKSKNKIYQISR